MMKKQHNISKYNTIDLWPENRVNSITKSSTWKTIYKKASKKKNICYKSMPLVFAYNFSIIICAINSVYITILN